MGRGSSKEAKSGRRVASYLVSSYTDLRDVILTIEQMILENYKIRNKPLLRKKCDLNIRPLGGREEYIVQVRMPEELSKK